MSEITTVKSDIQQVSFDLWLTLLDYKDNTFKYERNNMLREAIAPEMSESSFNSVQKQQDTESDLIAEESDTDQTFELRVARIAQFLGKTVPSEDLLSTMYERQEKLLMNNPPVLIEPDTTPKLLAELAEDRHVALISNTGFIHGDQLRKVIAHAGIIDSFSQLVFSNEVGVAKPNPRIFAFLSEKSGIEPSLTVHIGDNRRADYEGAKAAGMLAMHIAARAPLEASIVQALRGGN